jgi:hypothetical protein
MNINKIKWERIEEDFREPICKYCNQEAKWVLGYNVYEEWFWQYACSDHKDTGQFVALSNSGECTIKEIV